MDDAEVLRRIAQARADIQGSSYDEEMLVQLQRMVGDWESFNRWVKKGRPYFGEHGGLPVPKPPE